MRHVMFFAPAVLTLAMFANAQEPSASPAAMTQQEHATVTDRLLVESALKKYEAAYQHVSLNELRQVWPDLPNQKKEYRKAEDLLLRGDVSELHVSVEIQDVQVNGEDAVVRGVQSQQYLKNETSTYYGGDNTMAKVGTQTPGPVAESKKRTMKKAQDVTIHLHRKADTWTISSLEENGKHH